MRPLFLLIALLLLLLGGPERGAARPTDPTAVLTPRRHHELAVLLETGAQQLLLRASTAVGEDSSLCPSLLSLEDLPSVPLLPGQARPEPQSSPRAASRRTAPRAPPPSR